MLNKKGIEMKKLLLGLILASLLTLTGCFPYTDEGGDSESNGDIHYEGINSVGTSQLQFTYFSSQSENSLESFEIIFDSSGNVQVDEDIYIDDYLYQKINDEYYRNLNLERPSLTDNYIGPFFELWSDEIDLNDLSYKSEFKFEINVLGSEIPFYEEIFEQLGINPVDLDTSYAKVGLTFNRDLGYVTKIEIDITCIMTESYTMSVYGLDRIVIDISEYNGLLGPAPTHIIEIPSDFIIEE